MKCSILFLLLVMITGVNCGQNETKGNTDKALAVTDDTQMVYLFGDSSYTVTLSWKNDTTSVALEKRNDKIVQLLHQEWLQSQRLEYDTVDFNKDGVKDLLILQHANGAYPTYYLFLVDTVKKSLLKIDGFEQVMNPMPDSTNTEVIIGCYRAGVSEICHFYKINQGKLDKLPASFSTENMDDFDSLYNAALKKAFL